MDTLRTVLWVGVGGFVGANVRYAVGVWADTHWHLAGFPIGTLLVNTTGAFLLGFLATLLSEIVLVPPQVRLLVTVGLLGAYTTFSTFAFESVKLLEEGSWTLALLNMAGSVMVGGVAAWLGIALARSLYSI